MINRLKELRLKNGLTLAELSKNIKIPTSTLSKYENQKRTLAGINLFKLAEYFNVDPSYLLGKDDLSDVTIMTNMDDTNMVPFESHNSEARYATIAINQTLNWLDSDNMLLYADKRKKDIYSRNYELELLKLLHKTFGNMRDDFEAGLDRNIVQTEEEYVAGVKKYIEAFDLFQKFIFMDKPSQKLMIELAEQFYQNNKKASDD